MELKELRVGNYYYWNAEGKDYLCKFERRDFVRRDYKYFKPIALTEDWLIKFGFREVNRYWTCKNTNIWIGANMVFWYNTDLNGKVYLKHVHQLQNLYFALTQKELTF